jgi:hypothetical protein
VDQPQRGTPPCRTILKTLRDCCFSKNARSDARFLAAITLDCDPRRVAAARAKVSLLQCVPGVVAICRRRSNRDRALALVRGHFSSYLGNADDYNFTAVVARR